MRLLRYGEAAVLVEVADLDAVQGLRQRLEAAGPPGLLELVPAARTLLITFDPAATDHGELARRVRRIGVPAGVHPAAGPAPGREPLEIPVRYDGADLAAVATATGFVVPEVVRRHSAAVYTVAFSGFAPGFAYLRGLDPALFVSRRAAPRTRVPPGAVAIAGEWAAVYPSASPGGWQLLGHTELRVWDVGRVPPSLLGPGERVRFRCLD